MPNISEVARTFCRMEVGDAVTYQVRYGNSIHRQRFINERNNAVRLGVQQCTDLCKGLEVRTNINIIQWRLIILTSDSIRKLKSSESNGCQWVES